ncbi:MAG: hypothetical protein STSR0008_03840 [Ignavibacterium sp.]
MLNRIISYFKYSSVYLKEFFLLFIISALIITSFIKDSSILILIILFLFLSFLFIINLIGKKRKDEIEEISQIILNIRKNYYSNSSEIKLKESLTILENEIKSMFNRVQNDIEYLRKLERVRTEFLGNVSHELRTPIFAIQGYIETLLNGAIYDDKVNRYFLEKANFHTLALSNLLNDLIDISMIESGEMRMSFRYFNVYEFLNNIINEFLPTAQNKNLQLILLPFRKNLQLFGDKTRLRQVLVNLIMNALKYTEEGKVELLVEEEEKYGKIVVRDTGIGIPKEDLERIFERFYRVDKARSREVGGTGLGLAIVKHIIEAHNSKVEVKSEIDKGSEFSFKLKK